MSVWIIEWTGYNCKSLSRHGNQIHTQVIKINIFLACWNTLMEVVIQSVQQINFDPKYYICSSLNRLLTVLLSSIKLFPVIQATWLILMLPLTGLLNPFSKYRYTNASLPHVVSFNMHVVRQVCIDIILELPVRCVWYRNLSTLNPQVPEHIMVIR